MSGTTLTELKRCSHYQSLRIDEQLKAPTQETGNRVRICELYPAWQAGLQECLCVFWLVLSGGKLDLGSGQCSCYCKLESLFGVAACLAQDAHRVWHISARGTLPQQQRSSLSPGWISVSTAILQRCRWGLG